MGWLCEFDLESKQQIEMKSNKTYLLIIALLLLILTGCELFKKLGNNQRVETTETWSNAPDASTSKIRISTNLDNKQLKREFIDRMLKAGFKIDTNRSLSPLTTVMRRVENYYVQLFIDFEGSTATIYGSQGNMGINGISSELAEHHINWNPIKYNGKGWELMNATSNYRNQHIRTFNSNKRSQ